MFSLLFSLFYSSLWAQSQVTNAKKSDLTERLYQNLKPKIVQIIVLNKDTGEKSTLGSGFVIENDNLIATNYHVVAKIATRPNDFISQYRTTANELGDAELVAFNVINDLAILRAEKSISQPLSLAPMPKKGSSIFSLGNPHDLGFVIVNGVNNGIVPDRDPPLVFFSASLNSGMSGGPAVDESGNVVAVNVSVRRQSGDISFLVPAKYLRALINKAKEQSFSVPDDKTLFYSSEIDEQLLSESAYYFNKLLHYPKKYITLGELRFPSKLGKGFKCWDIDKDDHESDKLAVKSGFSCRQSRLYTVTDSDYYGDISITVKYLRAQSAINTRRFYNYVFSEQRLKEVTSFGYKSNNDEPVNCISDFVNIATHEFKTHICAQTDAKRNDIASVEVLATSVDRKNEAWILRLRIDGGTVRESLVLTQTVFADITLNTNENLSEKE